MQTDIPLKRLTALRATDFLPLWGLADATLLEVETLELPASATRLDNVLHLRSPLGQEYLCVIEWQGYRDAGMLWRLMSYMAWLGQRTPDVTVLGHLVYLNRACDVGNTLQQTIDGQVIQRWDIPCTRIWQTDARWALSTGIPGLAVLSPLMAQASGPLVEQAVGVVLDGAPRTEQGDLLSILGVFAEPLVRKERFVQMVGKEQLMASDLLSYLVDEKMAELLPELKSQLQAQLQQARQQEIEHLQATLEEVVATRYPAAPLTLGRSIRRVTDIQQLQRLIVAVVQTPDLTAFEQQLAQAVAAA